MHISDQTKKKKKHTVLKVLLTLIVSAALIVGVFAYKQRENIKAFVESRTHTSEELSARITESKQQVQDAISVYDLPITRDFTLEEEEKIRKGELSVEDAMKLITVSEKAEKTDTSSAEASSSGGSASSGQSGAQSDTTTASARQNPADSIVANYVQQVYGLKAYYIGALGQLESEMRSDYVNSGRDKTKIAGIIQSYMPRIGSLESECDGRIAALLASMRSELSAVGADTSIADTIYDAYLNEKALKKA
ncbi:MAG: hypothetical protein IJR59_02250, partial [Firmicutes bacterium]|nr:hypothetical protein [Bacillota bacterium]